jgi:2-hydroxychromene-2-carboxylate isomerase
VNPSLETLTTSPKMADRPVIDYYFSFISLWSYIGSRRLQRLVKDTNAKVVYKPIDIMYTFSISGYELPILQAQTSHLQNALRNVE